MWKTRRVFQASRAQAAGLCTDASLSTAAPPTAPPTTRRAGATLHRADNVASLDREEHAIVDSAVAVVAVEARLVGTGRELAGLVSTIALLLGVEPLADVA